MMKILRSSITLALGLVAAVAFSSCAYDPYYSSVGGSYSSSYDGGYGYGGYGDSYGYGGYGDGYGYGGSSFSTTIFVGTGDPRWGYDPYTYCYYDYNRRAYYDPYLYGYYPVGYRPPVVIGVPHPHGWSRGHSRIAPPSRIRNSRLEDYNDRAGAYRNSRHSWARQVRSQTNPDYGPVRGGTDRSRGSYQDRGRASQPVRDQDRFAPQRSSRPSTRSGFPSPTERSRDAEIRGSRLPSGYNTPAVQRSTIRPTPQPSPSRVLRQAPQRPQTRESARPEIRQSRPETRRTTPPASRQAPSPPEIQRSPGRGAESSRGENRGGRTIRGLGEG